MTPRKTVLTIAVVAAGACVAGACARPTTQFDRYIADGNWADAAREFAADSSLRDNDRALYQLGVLYGTPRRPTYNPDSARAILNSFLIRFPDSRYRDDATARLQLLEEMLSARQSAAARAREVEAQIAALTRETRDLRARFDSAAVHSDSLRAAIKSLEAERRERDEQLRLLRLELQRLKDIDLKPRRPPVTNP